MYGINTLSAIITKWSNTLKQFVGNLLTNCLSVFDHFAGLALKGLKKIKTKKKQSFKYVVLSESIRVRTKDGCVFVGKICLMFNCLQITVTLHMVLIFTNDTKRQGKLGCFFYSVFSGDLFEHQNINSYLSKIN